LLEKIERKTKRMSGRNAEIIKNGNAMKIIESKYIAKRKSKIETTKGINDLTKNQCLSNSSRIFLFSNFNMLIFLLSLWFYRQ
jgi:hypothetical protein